jgi:hypothetical protein
VSGTHIGLDAAGLLLERSDLFLNIGSLEPGVGANLVHSSNLAGEPANARSLAVIELRYVRLDVQKRCAIHDIDVLDEQPAAIDAYQPH